MLSKHVVIQYPVYGKICVERHETHLPTLAHVSPTCVIHGHIHVLLLMWDKWLPHVGYQTHEAPI